MVVQHRVGCAATWPDDPQFQGHRRLDLSRCVAIELAGVTSSPLRPTRLPSASSGSTSSFCRPSRRPTTPPFRESAVGAPATDAARTSRDSRWCLLQATQWWKWRCHTEFCWGVYAAAMGSHSVLLLSCLLLRVLAAAVLCFGTFVIGIAAAATHSPRLALLSGVAELVLSLAFSIAVGGGWVSFSVWRRLGSATAPKSILALGVLNILAHLLWGIVGFTVWFVVGGDERRTPNKFDAVMCPTAQEASTAAGPRSAVVSAGSSCFSIDFIQSVNRGNGCGCERPCSHVPAERTCAAAPCCKELSLEDAVESLSLEHSSRLDSRHEQSKEDSSCAEIHSSSPDGWTSSRPPPAVLSSCPSPLDKHETVSEPRFPSPSFGAWTATQPSFRMPMWRSVSQGQHSLITPFGNKTAQSLPQLASAAACRATSQPAAPLSNNSCCPEAHCPAALTSLFDDPSRIQASPQHQTDWSPAAVLLHCSSSYAASSPEPSVCADGRLRVRHSKTNSEGPSAPPLFPTSLVQFQRVLSDSTTYLRHPVADPTAECDLVCSCTTDCEF